MGSEGSDRKLTVHNASEPDSRAKKYLEGELKLKVNDEKSHIVHNDEGVKYLGVEIGSHYSRIQPRKVAMFKEKLKQMTKRNGGKPLIRVIEELNPVLRGFSQYFKIANATIEFKKVAGWLRRRLRGIQLRLWKTPGRLHRRLKQLGYQGPFKSMSMTSWRNARSPLSSYAMPNQWFDELGLYNLEQVRTGYVSSNYAR